MSEQSEWLKAEREKIINKIVEILSNDADIWTLREVLRCVRNVTKKGE